MFVRYGGSAGETANNMMDTVGNVWVISNNAKILTPKGLAKHTVKQTGKAMVLEKTEATSNGDIAKASTSGLKSNEIVEKRKSDSN